MARLGKVTRRRFAEILVGDGLITHAQLEEAVDIQRGCGDPLSAILLDLGYVTENDILKALSIQYQLPCLRPANYQINRKFVESFDPLLLHRHLVLPLDRLGNLMLVLLSSIPTKALLAKLQEASKCDLAIYLGTSSEIKQALVEIAPISGQDEKRIRASRGMGGEPAESDGGMLGALDISSEALLSSLDAAWESIFVASGEEDND